MSIDPNTLLVNTLTNVALNVVSNGLTSLLSAGGQKVKELVVGKETLAHQQWERSALAPILQRAIRDAAETAPWNAPKGVEIAALFLGTPEVEEVVRHIYATKIPPHKATGDLAAIRILFAASLAGYAAAYAPDLLPKADQLAQAASSLFDVLVQGCDLLLTKAIDEGILAAHEAKDSFRYNILRSQLDAIQKELELLTAPHKLDMKAILDFEKLYREQVGRHCSHITPPNMQAARRHPIDALYVFPSVTIQARLFLADFGMGMGIGRRRIGKSSFLQSMAGTLASDFKVHRDVKPSNILIAGEDRLDRDAFFARAYRAVILGNPGAGKSTLAVKLCYDLAHHYEQRLFAGRKELTPILVTLRQYGADRQERRCSLLEFIEIEAKRTYQLSSMPPQAFHYLLLTGRAVVIFDGLDELLDTSYRQEIRNDVELFCQLYPTVPVLVTSREVGYEQAPLDEQLFEVFHLVPFDNDQVKAYVHKWFTVADAEDLSPTRRQGLAEKFLADSTGVPDLRSNPLMLALLCTIYREEGYIPRYRPDVYEKCAVMLFEKWDSSRHIYKPPLPEGLVRHLMEYLAHWIYADEQLRAGITRAQLERKATVYLHEKLHEDEHKAERAAQEFITFCTGRAWVFTDTGTQKDGENLYQFAHATFLEYFTASHLVRASRSPAKMLAVLVPHIAKEEWDVVAQLAFQLYSRQNDDASDELLLALVKQSRAVSGKAGLNRLSFAARCLQFLLPRPQTRRAIAEACVERCIIWGCKQIEMGATQESIVTINDDEEPPGSLFDNFNRAIPENRGTIFDALQELLVSYVNGKNDNEAIIALEIAIDNNILDSIFELCAKRIPQLYSQSLLLCQDMLWDSKISISDFVRWYGVKGLFIDSIFIIKSNSQYGYVLESIFSQFIDHELKDHTLYSVYIKKLRDLGDCLRHLPLPWIKKEYKSSSYGIYLTELLPEKIDDLEADALFGLFMLWAMVVEENDRLTGQETRLMGERLLKQKFPHPMYLLLLARFRQDLLVEVPKLMKRCRFSEEQQEFVWRWVRKEITLVADE